jgi:hypothetical protein
MAFLEEPPQEVMAQRDLTVAAAAVAAVVFLATAALVALAHSLAAAAAVAALALGAEPQGQVEQAAQVA